jgi:hypothetical protein
MTKFIRYALATVCFAASVGCLALWWRSMSRVERLAEVLAVRIHSIFRQLLVPVP